MARAGNNHKGGRPKGSIAKSTAIAIKLKEKMAERLEKEFGAIMDAQIDIAKGIQAECYDKKTDKLYYKELGPNVHSFKNILEQVVGKPKESVELSGPDGEPIKLDTRISLALKKVYGDK